MVDIYFVKYLMDEVGDVFILDNNQQFIQISSSFKELFWMAFGVT